MLQSTSGYHTLHATPRRHHLSARVVLAIAAGALLVGFLLAPVASEREIVHPVSTMRPALAATSYRAVVSRPSAPLPTHVLFSGGPSAPIPTEVSDASWADTQARPPALLAALLVGAAAAVGLALGRRPAPRMAAAGAGVPLHHRLAMAAHLGQQEGQRLRTRLRATATGDLGACHNGKFLSAGQKAELERICALIGTPGKGITACDEGPGTIGARFEAVGIENTEENRRAYRQMLFDAPGANKYLSAAILDPETVLQKSDAGKPFPEMLMDLGIVPGVKPHLKVYELPGQDGATVMQGLDSLAVRCREYAASGCKFAKWRSPLTIDVAAGQPSDLVIQANMQDLARYALICQAEGLVPIVEPDIALTGDHDLETAVCINVKVQSVLYKAMLDHGVFMEGTILKSNMVNPGKKCPTPYTVEDIAQANLDVLRRCFPIAIRSANFLSGGQSLRDAAARLSVINQRKGTAPWNLSFSWSAALQMPLFQLCKGQGRLCLAEMSALYVQELEVAGAAARGEWRPEGDAGAHVPP